MKALPRGGWSAEALVLHMLRARDMELVTPGTLTVAIYPQFFPVAYLDEAGEVQGLDADLLRAFAVACGLRIRFIQHAKFDGIWDAPGTRTADVAAGGIANAIGRGAKGRVEWTLPYFYVHRAVLYRKWWPIRHFPGSVKGKVLGTPGSMGWMNAHGRMGVMGQADPQSMVPGTEDAADLRAVLRGEAQGLMRGDFVARALMALHPTQLAMTAWDAVPTLVPRDGEVFAFPTRSGSGVAVSLTAFLVQALHDGTLAGLAKKHGLGSVNPEELHSSGEERDRASRFQQRPVSARQGRALASHVAALLHSTEGDEADRFNNMRYFFAEDATDALRKPDEYGSVVQEGSPESGEILWEVFRRVDLQLGNHAVPDTHLQLYLVRKYLDVAMYQLRLPQLRGLHVQNKPDLGAPFHYSAETNTLEWCAPAAWAAVTPHPTRRSAYMRGMQTLFSAALAKCVAAVAGLDAAAESVFLRRLVGCACAPPGSTCTVDGPDCAAAKTTRSTIFALECKAEMSTHTQQQRTRKRSRQRKGAAAGTLRGRK